MRVRKPIRRYINDLPEHIKKQALENVSNDIDLIVYSLDEALSNAFTWEFTPQGHKYWSDIASGITP